MQALFQSTSCTLEQREELETISLGNKKLRGDSTGLVTVFIPIEKSVSSSRLLLTSERKGFLWVDYKCSLGFFGFREKITPKCPVENMDIPLPKLVHSLGLFTNRSCFLGEPQPGERGVPHYATCHTCNPVYFVSWFYFLQEESLDWMYVKGRGS